MNKNIKILVASLLCSLTFTYINANATKAKGPYIKKQINNNFELANRYSKQNNINEFGEKNVETQNKNVFEQIDLKIDEINKLYNSLLNRYNEDNKFSNYQKRKYNNLIEQLKKYYETKYDELKKQGGSYAEDLKNYYDKKVQFIIKLNNETEELKKIDNKLYSEEKDNIDKTTFRRRYRNRFSNEKISFDEKKENLDKSTASESKPNNFKTSEEKSNIQKKQIKYLGFSKK